MSRSSSAPKVDNTMRVDGKRLLLHPPISTAATREIGQVLFPLPTLDRKITSVWIVVREYVEYVPPLAMKTKYRYSENKKHRDD